MERQQGCTLHEAGKGAVVYDRNRTLLWLDIFSLPLEVLEIMLCLAGHEKMAFVGHEKSVSRLGIPSAIIFCSREIFGWQVCRSIKTYVRVT
jgi:hypothetical protein